MSELYEAIKSEMKRLKIMKKEVSEGIGKLSTNTNVWSTLKSGKIRFFLIAEICELLKLDLIIMNPRKTRNSEHNILKESLAFYKCINSEKEDFGYSNHELAKLVGADTSRGNVWSNITSLGLQYNQVVTICDALGLELIIRSPTKKISYQLNNPKTKK